MGQLSGLPCTYKLSIEDNKSRLLLGEYVPLNCDVGLNLGTTILDSGGLINTGCFLLSLFNLDCVPHIF